ncbi:MAG: serine hydrolase domain-containing protein, partial [Bacteroidota bacterium]
MNLKPFYFIFTSLFLFTYLKAQISEHGKLKVDKILSELDANEPGIIIGIVTKEESYAKGKGKEVMGKAAQLSPQTPFFLSSISKEFIGVTIAQLVLEGTIELNAPIQEYITDFPTYEVNPTIYQVLHHSSGIKDYSNLLYFRGEVFDDFLPIGYIIELLKKQKSLNFTPGSNFLYSNSNYELLAEVISRVTGKDFRDYIKENIFEPIGMNNTYFAGNQTASVVGYRMNRNNILSPFPKGDSPPVSVAQIISTVNDMALWDKYLTKKLFDQDKLGSLLLTKGKLDNGRQLVYSMGFEHFSYKEQSTIGHGGFSRGFQGNHTHFKDHGFSIIIFSNSLKYNTNYYTNRIADILFKDIGIEKTKNKNTPIPNLILSKKESKPYLGSYYSPQNKMERVIYRDQGIMRYNRPDKFESRLVSLGNHEFQMLNGNNELTSKISFEFYESGINILKYHFPNSDQVVEYYKFDYHDYKPKELQQFEGTYYSEELDFEFKIKVSDGKLELFRAGKKVSTLKVFKENTFRDNKLAGIFEFEKDGIIKGFLLSQ